MTAIKPDYYHKNNLDWFEAFEKLASQEFDPFKAAMVENIGEYIFRYPEKNELEDLEKA